MIKVKVKSRQVVISGHAMFADPGQDIVCAAASSIVITTVNGILIIDDKALSYKKANDELVIDILKDSSDVKKLINNMISLLKELSMQYKDNIQIYEEV